MQELIYFPAEWNVAFVLHRNLGSAELGANSLIFHWSQDFTLAMLTACWLSRLKASEASTGAVRKPGQTWEQNGATWESI